MIRKPAVAGAFYTDNPFELQKEIKNYLSGATYKNIKNIKALISPHAGYIYSGHVAAEAYKQLENKIFNTVVVFAPCHRGIFDGVSIFDGEGYETPLGVVEIDTDNVKKLIDSSGLINFIPEAHLNEHSLEVQVPFLQITLENFKLIPVLVGTHNINQLKEIANIFNETLKDKNILYIASTDLSHFYDSKKAEKLDSIAIKHIKNLDFQNFYNSIIEKKTEACGAGPVLITLYLANINSWNSCEILKYADSGDVSGDKSNVVGYVSAVIFEDNNSGYKLTEYEKETLHKIAKESIRAKLFGEKFNLDYERTDNLKQVRGAFVTLHKHGNLRGCIGYIQGIASLDETVKDMAVAAAFEDPRFPSLTKEEFNEIDIEISALTPLKKIEDINEIEVGTHGILMRKGFQSGVLLPQVATEYNWDRETFLEQTCFKAGLGSNCWKDKDTEIYIFSAEVF